MTYQLYVNGKPIEEYTEAERETFAKQASDRLGRILDELLSGKEFTEI